MISDHERETINRLSNIADEIERLTNLRAQSTIAGTTEYKLVLHKKRDRGPGMFGPKFTATDFGTTNSGLAKKLLDNLDSLILQELSELRQELDKTKELL